MENLIHFFIPDTLEGEQLPQAKILCLSAPVLGFLSLFVFLFPKDPDEILVGFGIFGSILLMAQPFILKFSGNYKLASAVFTSVCLALFPLCLFEYGGLFSPVLIWLPLMPILLSYLMGWKEAASITALMAVELMALSLLDTFSIHTTSALMAMTGGVLLAYRLEAKKKTKEFELSDTQNSLEEALRAKELFWNNISHEIRTPLNGILGMTQVLLEGKTNREQEELLRIIKESGIHLKAVLNDVVDYSQLELGDLKIKREPFVVDESLKKVTSMFGEYLEHKDVQLSYEVNRYFPEALLTDSYRVKQVLIHLVSNAIKFTQTGFVKVRAEVTDDENVFLFSVTDSGKGIKRQAHSKIFTTFYQGDISTTREHGGAGLGLALCKRLVELMGGSIDFESTEGRGSHFYFTVQAMPLDITHEVREKESQALSSVLTEYNLNKASNNSVPEGQKGVEKESLNALIVEDNAVNLKLMETLLKQMGHNVSLAMNGKEALNILERHDFDIVFMDIQMPIMDGIECTKNIMKTYGEDRPAIVAVTANIQQRDECMALGMDEFISKPINIKKIKLALNKVLTHHRDYTLPVAEPEVEVQIHPIEESYGGHTLLFDPKAFTENFGNDHELIEFLISQFSESAPRLLEDINRALIDQKHKELESAAHSLKGALSNFFCLELREMAYQLETCGKKKDFKKALGIYYELKNSVGILQSELDSVFRKKKAAS